MDIKTLKQFEAVVRERSVGAAAKKLGLTQPAISMGLARLQKELGIKLLKKSGSGVTPTPEGLALIEPVCRVLEAFEALETSILSLKPEARTLKISLCDRGPEWFFVPRFRLFIAEKENFEVKTQLSSDADAVKQLKEGSADIIITEHPVKEKGITCNFLVRDIHYLSVPLSHPLADKKEIELGKAGELSVLFYRLDGAFSSKFLEFLKTKTPNVKLQIEEDYFVFQERLRRTEVLTFTTDLVRHYRFDGMKRDDIAMIDSDSDIGYWISYRTDARESDEHAKMFFSFAQELVKTSGPLAEPKFF